MPLGYPATSSPSGGGRHPSEWVAGLARNHWPACVGIRTTDAALTRRRMIHTTGLVSRQVTEIGLNRIESVQIRQGIIGRLCGYGDLIVSGTGIGNIVIGGVADPMTTRVGILDAQQVAQTTPVGSPLA